MQIERTDPPSPARVEAPVRHLREWSSLLSQSFMNFSVESARPAQFRGSLGIRTIAGIDFIQMTTGSHAAYRDAKSIGAAERPDFLLCLQVAGVGEFLQDGRTARLNPGDITVFDTTRPTTVISSTHYRNLCMRFPQRLLDVPVAQMRQLTATRFDGREGLAPAAGAVLDTLNRVADTLPGRSQQLAAHNALDLMSTLFESTLGLADGRQRRAGAALLERMLDFIEKNLGDPELSPQTLAVTHFVSLRQVHSVFSAAGLTASAHILDRRLEHARRDLVDPALSGISVATIAERWGFRSASHFGRSFKEHFARTPADYRHTA
ncbi:helix-turn-helix domain-containing protein [Lacisediminihabitans profunda]|uniref:Helix-turn-helix domain-containing protein n=1 Tax=Lacisediminihabitans profunda TaxID=2594790 RepID=A0A5C8UUA4_9MICO|nr:helix-turn-helix domain-containing protein [Lacisediminihabitans profunda]TXN31169.1 helix-turn-helix domain-containing protein [Lacisediminihabitans profunda]